MTKNSKQSQGANGLNAIDLLIDDHDKALKLFEEFDKLTEADADRKEAIVEQACLDLTIHAQIEEEIFYPAVRAIAQIEALVDEAQVEHAGARDLIEQLEQMEPGEDLYDARFKVLGENIAHHIKEEQDEMFPMIRRSKLDLKALGTQMAARKVELREVLA